MSIMDNLPELRKAINEVGEDTKGYFREGAETVLGDSGIDSMLMLGVFVWAYMDLMEHAKTLRQLTVGLLQQSGRTAFEIDETPPKGGLN